MRCLLFGWVFFSGFAFATESVYFAWNTPKKNYLLIPKLEKLTLKNKVEKLTKVFCSISGAHEVKFQKHIGKTNNDEGMPIDSEASIDALSGARFVLNKGKIDDQDECLITDDAFAKSHRFVRWERGSFEACSSQTKKRLAKHVSGKMKSCDERNLGKEFREVTFGKKGDVNQSYALISKDVVVVEDLGNPESEYGGTYVDAIMAFIPTNGAPKILMQRSHHETVTKSLDELKEGALREITSFPLYNRAGG